MTKQEYQPDDRPALELTKKGKAVGRRLLRGYVITDAGRAEMNQPLPMDQYPVIALRSEKE